MVEYRNAVRFYSSTFKNPNRRDRQNSFFSLVKFRYHLNLYAPTSQNGQTHSNN